MASEQPTDSGVASEQPADSGVASEQPADSVTAPERPADSGVASEQPADSGTAPEQPTSAAPTESVSSTLRPEDITCDGLPVAMRGYDRGRVERLLARVAEAYAMTLQQSESLRDRLQTYKAELEAAEGDAQASAKSVAELMQRSARADEQLAQTQKARADLEALLEQSEGEHKRALAGLQAESDREVARRLPVFEEHPIPSEQADVATPQPPVADGEAARLLVAAARAADDLRTVSRTRALRTLTKARKQSAVVHEETERERVALAAMQQRRDQVEQETDAILTRVRTEADRVKAASEDERHRVRGLLTGALALLDAEPDAPPEDLMVDLSSRVDEVAKGTVT